jgi:hypothetical protein
MRKLPLLAAIAAIAVAVPATAKPSHPAHPGAPHRCTPHKVAYVASGTLQTWSLEKNSDGTYSGTLVVDVKHANRFAKGDVGNAVTYTLSSAKVRLGDGVGDPPAAGSLVKLIGKVSALAKRCDQTGFVATTTIGKVVVHTPATTG